MSIQLLIKDLKIFKNFSGILGLMDSSDPTSLVYQLVSLDAWFWYKFLFKSLSYSSGVKSVVSVFSQFERLFSM